MEESEQKVIGEIIGLLGSQGIEVLGKVLTDCENRQARKAATDALIQKGELAQRWVLKTLTNPEQPWYLLRNALMILRFVGKGPKAVDRARNFASHAHPRVRDEALHTLLTLKAGDAEQLVINALGDPDDKVLWRATSALGELTPLSEASIAKLVEMLKTDIPEEPQVAAIHSRKVSNIIRAMGTMVNIKNIQAIEDVILDTAQMIDGQNKGILQRLKKSSSPYQKSILSASIATLAKIGTSRSEAFLDKLAGGKTPQAEPARKAAENIRVRYAKQTAGASATT